jgi:hypothetical protein
MPRPPMQAWPGRARRRRHVIGPGQRLVYAEQGQGQKTPAGYDYAVSLTFR